MLFALTWSISLLKDNQSLKHAMRVKSLFLTVRRIDIDQVKLRHEMTASTFCTEELKKV